MAFSVVLSKRVLKALAQYGLDIQAELEHYESVKGI